MAGLGLATGQEDAQAVALVPAARSAANFFIVDVAVYEASAQH